MSQPWLQGFTSSSWSSIKPILTIRQKEVNRHMTVGAPRERGMELGAFGKISGIDCRHFLHSPHPLLLLRIFRTPSQFRSLRVSFWKRLLRRLRTSLHLATIVSRALQPPDGRIPCPVDRNLEIFLASHIDVLLSFRQCGYNCK